MVYCKNCIKRTKYELTQKKISEGYEGKPKNTDTNYFVLKTPTVRRLIKK